MSTAIFDAIKAGDETQVRQLLDSDPGLLDARDENGLGAYMAARYSRQPAIAQLLLERGVTLDIFAACMAENAARVSELLAADPGVVNSYSHDGWTPLHLAAFFNQPSIAETLLERGADVYARSLNEMRNTPLHAAAAGRSMDVVRLLLAHGADVNAKQHGGWMALHAAAQSGDLEMAALLVSLGADVKARADNNQNAMDLALLKGQQAMVDLFDEHGAE